MGHALSGGPSCRTDPPDVHLVRGYAPDEIDETPVRRPTDVMLVDARLVDADLPGVSAVPIGNEDRVPWNRRVVHDASVVGGPGRLNGARQEWARHSTDRGHEQDAMRLAVLGVDPEPNMGPVVGETDVVNDRVCQLGRIPTLGEIQELAAPDLTDPGV